MYTRRHYSAPGPRERHPWYPHWPMLASPRSLIAQLVLYTGTECESCGRDGVDRVKVGGEWLCLDCAEKAHAEETEIVDRVLRLLAA